MFLSTRTYRLFVIGFLACYLGACGQAGPLYLPQDTEAQTNDQSNEQSNDQTKPDQQSRTPAPQAELVLNDGQVQEQALQVAQVKVVQVKAQQ